MAVTIKKRMKLSRLVSGPALKQIYGVVLSGYTAEDGGLIEGALSSEVWRDVYVVGQEGDLLNTAGAPISADSTLYNAGFFEREYSIENPDIDDDGADLQVGITDSDIMDMVQYGDYAFNMTNETTMGNRYRTATTINATNGWYVYDPEYYMPNVDPGYYLEKHELAYYPSTGDLSGQLADGSYELSGVAGVINNLSFNFDPETPDIVYGLLSGDTLMLYVKDQAANSGVVYSPENGIPNSLPFAYLMEQPLTHSVNFGRLGHVYGSISADTTFVYSPLVSAGLDEELYSPYANEDDDFAMYYNPFKLKNMYNYNWNCEYDEPREEMTGWRDYLKVGNSQNTLWLSYKYYRENPTDVQEFQLVERVGGLFKYRHQEGHKSNIYSIRIFNSGLNDDMDNTDEQRAVQSNLKEIIEETVRNVVKKIAPSSTQLWKIDYDGR